MPTSYPIPLTRPRFRDKAEVRHDEGKATSFMRDEAGTDRFRSPGTHRG